MKYIRKALMAAAGAFVAGLGSSAAAGKLDWAGAGTALGLAVAAGIATWRVENARALPPVNVGRKVPTA